MRPNEAPTLVAPAPGYEFTADRSMVVVASARAVARREDRAWRHREPAANGACFGFSRLVYPPLTRYASRARP